MGVYMHVSLMCLNSGKLRVTVVFFFVDSLLAILYDLMFQGAPEIIQDRLINIPPSYVETYKKYTRQGSRVLALAYKSLSDMTVRIIFYMFYIVVYEPYSIIYSTMHSGTRMIIEVSCLVNLVIPKWINSVGWEHF